MELHLFVKMQLKHVHDYKTIGWQAIEMFMNVCHDDYHGSGVFGAAGQDIVIMRTPVNVQNRP